MNNKEFAQFASRRILRRLEEEKEEKFRKKMLLFEHLAPSKKNFSPKMWLEAMDLDFFREHIFPKLPNCHLRIVSQINKVFHNYFQQESLKRRKTILACFDYDF